MNKFPFCKQLDAMDCGPASLAMVAQHYGKPYPLEHLRSLCYLTREGVNLLGISEAAEKIGFRTLAVKVPAEKLIAHAPFPCILHWNQNHFVVLYKATNSYFYIADPAHGKIKLKQAPFLKSWLSQSAEGIALLLEPAERFYSQDAQNTKNHTGFRFLLPYLRPFRWYVVQLFLSMLLASILSLAFPFLTQILVDKGIHQRNPQIVVLILVSQLLLFVGTTSIELIRGWILLHINSRINIAIISDFLMKLMRLPIRYFDAKLVGDIRQRIGDHSRIQSFLTGSALPTAFSMVNLLVFTIVLATYSLKILFVFLCFSILGVGWMVVFLKKRKEFDYIRFQQMSDNDNVIFELITGMQEIKLNSSETLKRWNWEKIQIKLFRLNIKSLALGQYQQIGSSFFNQLKNILISYFAAIEVISGRMTLGMMMAVSYIVGQVNSPIQLLLGFIQSAQDVKISLDRLGEIHQQEDENAPFALKPDHANFPQHTDQQIFDRSLPNLSAQYNLTLNNVSFQYTGTKSPFVLKDICMAIPQGKITAIVGMSGSGKTTLMKLLLKFYEPTSGEIMHGKQMLCDLSPEWWRNQCGVVMQDGFIFNDTIAGNIAMGEASPNHERLKHAVEVANIRSFIESLPMTYLTQIGSGGIGISAGQRQRLLIARAVYKNPEYLFFDEATSALDANNEKEISNNLAAFFARKTVVIIAHRLSTVKHADQIVVLEEGCVLEIGNHAELLSAKGRYYELVKNQLEISA